MTPKTCLRLVCFSLILATLACALPSTAPPAPDVTDTLSPSDSATASARAEAVGEEANKTTQTSTQSVSSPEPTAEIQLAPTITMEASLAPAEPIMVAYIMNNDVWFWQEGSHPRLLTEFNDVRDLALSDDATMVAFSRELDYGSWELWVVATDESIRRVLVDSDTFAEMTYYEDDLTGAPLQIEWVPDQYQVIFNTRFVYEGPGMVRYHELYQVDVNTSSLVLLIDVDLGGDFYFSPDGTKIALVQPDRISVINADGTAWRELLNFPHIDTGSEWWYYPSLVWTQDSSAVRVIIPPEHPMSNPSAAAQIYHLPINGSSPRVLSDLIVSQILFEDPVLSPNAAAVAYLTLSADNPAQNTLFISDVTGTEVLVYDSGLISILSWSPDNSHFIYTNFEIYRLGEIGAEPRGLNIASRVFDLVFVDESRFLYRFSYPGAQELWLGSIDGSQTMIASGGGVHLKYDFVK